jgi:hypothetical protein
MRHLLAVTDLATVALFIASPAYADPDPHMSNPLAGLFSRGGLPLERGERARSSRVWWRRDFVDRSIQNYCPDKAPISHENSAFRLHHHHGWYGHRRSHHTGTAAANAEPRCMNYMWYRACHDPATDKWQLCNLYNDGQCHGAPAPVAPSPFDPIR